MKVKELKQMILEKLEKFSDDSEVVFHPNTYGLSGEYLATHEGFVELEEVVQFETIRKLIRACPTGCRFCLTDTEGETVWCDSEEKVIEWITGGDEEYGLEVHKDGKYLGWFRILPYEGEDAICDYSGNNEFCEKVAQEVSDERI